MAKLDPTGLRVLCSHCGEPLPVKIVEHRSPKGQTVRRLVAAPTLVRNERGALELTRRGGQRHERSLDQAPRRRQKKTIENPDADRYVVDDDDVDVSILVDPDDVHRVKLDETLVPIETPVFLRCPDCGTENSLRRWPLRLS